MYYIIYVLICTYKIMSNKNTKLTSRFGAVKCGEVSLIIGEDAGVNLAASTEHCEILSKSGNFDVIYYINIPFSRRKLSEAVKEKQFGCKVVFMDGLKGNAVEHFYELDRSVSDPARTAVIVNSWELSSISYRRREELLWEIKKAALGRGMTVIVYGCGRAEKVRAGQYNRVGFGKLTMLADSVLSINDNDADELSTEILPVDPPKIISPQKVDNTGSVNLSTKRINDLHTPDHSMIVSEIPQIINRNKRQMQNVH